MHSIIYGLLSAIGWGTADFVGGISARRTGAFQSVLFVEMLAITIIPLIAIGIGEPMISAQEWLWCAGAGIFGVLALAILYQSFEEGQMSIAAPVSAVISAALPIVVGFFTQGAQEFTRVIGFILALVAIWLISLTDTNNLSLLLRVNNIRLPTIAGIGFGLYFILIYQGSQQAIFWPIIASRSAGMLVLAIVIALRRQRLLARRGAWPLLFLNFILDLAANIAFILAAQKGRMDIAAVLTSLYPGMTILLAWLILKEHIRKSQFVGILLALAAIVFITK